MIGYGSNAEVTAVTSISGSMATTAATTIAFVDTVLMWSTQASVAHEKYDAAFVKRVLDADAKPPEAKFANVIDMMDWLDRD